MSKPTIYINLDLQDSSSKEIVDLKRTDKGRLVQITLYDGGQPYLVGPYTSVAFIVQKPNGNISYEECSVDGYTLTYVVSDRITQVPGEMDCELTFYDNTDGSHFTGPTFGIVVDETIYDHEDEVETPERPTRLLMAPHDCEVGQYLRIVEVNSDGTAVKLAPVDSPISSYYTPTFQQLDDATIKVTLEKSEEWMPDASEQTFILDCDAANRAAASAQAAKESEDAADASSKAAKDSKEAAEASKIAAAGSAGSAALSVQEAGQKLAQVQTAGQNAVNDITDTKDAGLVEIVNQANRELQTIGQAGTQVLSSLNQVALAVAQDKQDVTQLKIDAVQAAGEAEDSAAAAAQTLTAVNQKAQEVEGARQEVASNAEAVRQDKAAVALAKGEAETARAGAVTAQGLAEQARTGAQTAQGKAEEAQSGAENAQARAEAAEAGAIQARNAAEEFKNQAAEILNSLPPSYDALSGKVDSLAIVCQSEGTLVHVEDSSHNKIPEFTVFGRSAQKTTTGKNLCPTFTLGSSNGITYSVGSDGSVIANGTAVGSNAFLLGTAFTLAPGTYTIGGTPSYSTIGHFDFLVYALETATTIARGYTGSPNATFILDETTEIQVRIRVAVGDTATNATFFPQIESGSVATEFEEYTGGIPSPNPQHPQPITSVADGGEMTVTVTGENLLPYPYHVHGSSSVNGITYTIADDGSVTLNGTATEDFNTMLLSHTTNLTFEKYFRGKTLTLTGAPIGSKRSETYWLQVWNHDGKGSVVYAQDSTPVATFVMDNKGANWNIGINVKGGITCNNVVFKPMLTLDSVASDYSRYTSTTATLTNTGHSDMPIFSLCGIPVSSGGNVTIDGQQYIADTLTKFADGTGEVVKRCCITVLDGSENWIMTVDNVQTRFGLAKGIPINDRLTPKYSSHFIFSSSLQDKTFNVYPSGYIDVVYLDMTNKDEFKSFLAAQKASGNPVTVLSSLVEPITIPLTAAEVAELEKLYTFKPVSNIYNDANAHMEVSYIADPKTYIDNKFAALAEAITAP